MAAEGAVVGWRKGGDLVTVVVVVAVEGGLVEDNIFGTSFTVFAIAASGACKESGLLEAARHRVWIVVVLAAVLFFVPVVAAVLVVETEDAEFCRVCAGDDLGPVPVTALGVPPVVAISGLAVAGDRLSALADTSDCGLLLPGVLGGGTPLEAFLGGSLPLPTPESPMSLPTAVFENAVAEIPDTAVLLGTGFGVVSFGELIVAD